MLNQIIQPVENLFGGVAQTKIHIQALHRLSEVDYPERFGVGHVVVDAAPESVDCVPYGQHIIADFCSTLARLVPVHCKLQV